MNPASNDQHIMWESLVKWFQSIVPNRTIGSVDDLCDGVAMLEALVQIAPEHFNKLEPKIKKDSTSSSYIRISNVKKIVEAVKEYHQDVLSLRVDRAACPEAAEIANGDAVHIVKLLRLILGCAINCERKEEYFLKITHMEESVEKNIMQAIQELRQVPGSPEFRSSSSPVLDPNYSKTVGELEAARKAEAELIQRCQQLEIKVQNLLQEKHTLTSENQSLKDNESRNVDVRKQNETLKEQLLEVEDLLDDCKAKASEQEKQLRESQKKIAELQLAASDTSRLKDQLDALSESAIRAQALEVTVASLRTKLEEHGDIKKTLAMLEEKNMDYLQKNLEYEEQLASEVAKSNAWRNQCTTYKKQLAEIERKLDEETQRADKAQFAYEKLDVQFVALQGEKDRTARERDGLKEEVAELKIVGQAKGDRSGASMSDQLTPTGLKERLRHFERENKSLKAAVQEHETTKAALESAQSRLESLQAQKRATNQRLLQLEAQLGEQIKNDGQSQAKTRLEDTDNTSPEGLTQEEYKQKVAMLRDALAAKEDELLIAQGKYVRLRAEVQQADRKSSEASTQQQAQMHMKEMEERLLASTYYRLGMYCHREAMDRRLGILGQKPSHVSSSFLATQRQSVSRKPMQKFPK